MTLPANILTPVPPLSLPHELGRRISVVQAQPGATGTDRWGFSGHASRGTWTSADDSDGPWANIAAATGDYAYSIPATAYGTARRDWAPLDCACVIKQVDATSVRLWAGLFSASPSASATPNIHAAAFRYDTGADATAFWRAVTIAGTGASAEVTATVVAAAANAVLRFRIEVLSNAVNFYNNGTLVAAHATVLPAETQLIGPALFITDLASGGKSIKLGKLALVLRGPGGL